jgi:DinB superfamily
MNRILIGCLAMLLSPLVAAAQQAAAPGESNPVSNAVRSVLERQSKNIVVAAEEMPADKYPYRPTPAQMSFAELVEHVTASNNFLCAKIAGQPASGEEKPSAEASKEKLVSGLKTSFEFCTQALAKVDDSNLGEQLTVFGGRKISRGGAMIMLTSGYADHYGMAAIYLRLNGLLPPTAKPKKE